MNKSLQEILTMAPSEPLELPKCSVCGGWGKYLSLQDGKCDYCRRENPRPCQSESLKDRKRRKMAEEQKMIEKLLEESDQNYQEVKLDSQGVRQSVKELKLKMEKNILDRTKHPDDPVKFIESETDLLEQIIKLSAISTIPSLYPELLESGLGSLFLELLQHQNTDMSIELLKLLNELTSITDGDEGDDNAKEDGAEEGVVLLIEDLHKRNFFSIMVDNISRFKEFENDDDVDGVFYTLSFIENIMEFMPEIGVALCEKTSILKFLLKRIDTRQFDQNKLYASEIMSIMLQSDSKCTDYVKDLMLDDVPALVVLLKSLSLWKRRDPRDTEEQECLENEFNCLFILLLNQHFKSQFFEVEGFELMKMFIENGRYGKANAIKCFDYALQGSKENCKQFMEANLLKFLIPAFMGRSLGHPMRKKEESRKVVEHVISTLETLFNAFSKEDVHYFRLQRKFEENDFEKTNRALDLFVEYWEKVSKVSVQPVTIEEIDPGEQTYLAKLDAGLFSLQKLSVIVGHVCSIDATAAHVRAKCKEQSIDLANLIACVEDYYDSFDDEVAAEKSELFVNLIILLKKNLSAE